jgi:signal transduction histidine kinase
MRKALFLIFLISLQIKSVAQLVTQEPEQIKINLGWAHQFQFAGYYAALENGYFLEEGLDVELVATIQEDNIGSVLSGDFHYGIATGGVILSDDRYAKISVIAAIYQQSPVALLSLKSGNIRHLKDTEGKDVIGGPEIRSMLASAGVDLEKVNFHGKVSNFGGLVKGKLDATAFFITDQALLIGNDSLLFEQWRPIEYGINFYGDCLFSSRVEARAHPDRVERIKRAVIRGWQYTVDHPAEMVDLIIAKYNQEMDREILLKESRILINNLILPQFYDIGDMQLSKWSEMAKILYEFGIIGAQRDLEGFLFKPEPALARPLKIIIWVALLIIVVGLGFLLVLFIYNRQLRKAVEVRTESLEKANEELDRFVYSISHDIRSPLSSVQGIINLMKIEQDNHEQYLELIESSIRKLDNYTRDILDYTRNSRAKVEPKIVYLDEIVEKCINQVKYMDDREDVSIRKKIQLDRPISTDPWRLEVILTNLIGNALKYGDPKKKEKWVQIEAEIRNNNLVLTISDNGIGIDQFHLDKIYNMFYRASEDSQGSGLGLYIVRETVHLLGGKIDIQSEKNKGTAVTVTLTEK